MGAIQKMVEHIESGTDFIVLSVYDYDENSYIMYCMDKISKSVIGDFIYLVNKKTEKKIAFNPMSNMEKLKKMRNARKIYDRKVGM